MKTEKLNVGCKIGTEHFAVACSVRVPENAKEALDVLCKGSVEFFLQMFIRGWRIWNQEQSGARDFVSSATVAERKAEGFAAKVQAIIDNADPLSPAKRTGRPAKPVTVTVTPDMTAAMKKGDVAAFNAMLAAAGVKVTLTK